MNIHDIRIIIGEYLRMNEIDILAKIFGTNEWNVYDYKSWKSQPYNYMNKSLNISDKDIPKDIYEIGIGIINNLRYPFCPKEFPDNVHTIKINYIDLPNKFPRFLHTLKIRGFPRPIYTNILPRYLYELRLSNINLIFNKKLPKGLRILQLKNIGNCITINDFPRNLHELDISETRIDNINNLPQKLCILNITESKISSNIINVNKLPKDLIMIL
jgi:hypothetical protein